MIWWWRHRIRMLVAWYMELRGMNICYACENTIVELKGQICRYCLLEEE
jgi:hypothetical protein